MDARVCLRLLGEFELAVDGESIELASSRVRTLLGYLAVHADRRHSRERLAYLMWPDSTDAQARTNLRNVLHQVRHAHDALGGLLEITRDTVRWHHGLAWVDAHEIVSRASSSVLDDLRAVADLYRGDLLEDCYDECLSEARERYRRVALDALARLADALDERGKSAEMLVVAQRLVRLDPISEEHHRFVIRACMAAGDRPAALRAFHACAAVLRDELGLAPSSATEALLALDGWAASVPASASDVGRADPTPLVGRESERAHLVDLWNAVVRGRRPHLVALVGEPGIGKSRLADAVAAWAGRHGACVCRSQAYASERELPYATLADWLRTPAVAGGSDNWSLVDRRALARIVPDLAVEPPEVVQVDPDQREALWRAAVRALTGVGAPLMLLADDVMWADRASLEFIHYAVRAAEHPILVVATARSEDVDDPVDEHRLVSVERTLAGIERHTRLTVGGLSVVDTRELASAVLAEEVSDDRAAALHAETAGNPLFVLETIRAGWGPASQPSGRTPRLEAVIEGRLRKLTSRARDVLAAAGVIGRAFRADLLAAVIGVDDDDLVAALDELWRRGMIVEHGSDGYDFAHGTIRDAAVAALGPAKRRWLHGRVAEALVLGNIDDALAGHIAAHLDRSDRPAQSVEWYVRAALVARRMQADHAAVAALDRALARLPDVDPSTRLAVEWEILGLLPTALVGVVGYSSPRLSEVHDRALAVAAQLGEEPGPPLLRSRVMSALCRDDFDGAEAMANELRSAAAARGDAAWRLECEYLTGIIDFWSGRVESASRHFELVRERFDRADRAEHIVSFGNDPQVVCVSRLANARWLAGDPAAARRHRDEAHALAQVAGHRFTSEVVLVFDALLALDLGEFDRFAKAAAAFGTGEDRSLVHTVVGGCLTGVAAALAGHTSGLAEIQRALALTGNANLAPGHRACLTRMHVAAQLAAGDPTRALTVVDSALALGGTRLWEPELHRARAVLLAATDSSPQLVEGALGAARESATRRGLPGHLPVIETTAKRLRNGRRRTIGT